MAVGTHWSGVEMGSRNLASERTHFIGELIFIVVWESHGSIITQGSDIGAVAPKGNLTGIEPQEEHWTGRMSA